MKNCIITLLLGVLLSNSFAQSKFSTKDQDLKNRFKTPTNSARSYTWWHWVDGNISKERIIKDLEAMKAGGIAGYQQFSGTANYTKLFTIQASQLKKINQFILI